MEAVSLFCFWRGMKRREKEEKFICSIDHEPSPRKKRMDVEAFLATTRADKNKTFSVLYNFMWVCMRVRWM